MTDTKNQGFCNGCGELVPAGPVRHSGAVYLRKHCPNCGDTETVISSLPDTYVHKRTLDKGFDYIGCQAQCPGCEHANVPNIVFVDLTNRCNLDCLCCIANIPTMGFRFEPPKEYFQRVFEHVGRMKPRPSVQFFGGEPTVRKDLFELISMAQGQGLSVRIVTNGLKLADAEFCEKLVATKATILISFDGLNPETYRVLRGQSKMLGQKLRAMENLAKARKPKVVIMSLVAKGLNDADIAEMIQKCHDEWPFVRSIQFIPLTHTWESGSLDYEPERITPDDVEVIIDDAFPDQHVEFIPAGTMLFNMLQEVFDRPPIPFGGVHPNCESMSLLLSCGDRFVPLGHFLTTSLADAVLALQEADVRLRKRIRAQEGGLAGSVLNKIGLWKHWRRLVGVATITAHMRRHMDFPRLLGCERSQVPGRLLRFLGTLVLTGRSSKAAAKYAGFGRALQFIILPFEDRETLETNRLERCKAAFAFINPETDQVNTVPVCAWTLFSSDMMRGIAERYGTVSLSEVAVET